MDGRRGAAGRRHRTRLTGRSPGIFPPNVACAAVPSGRCVARGSNRSVDRRPRAGGSTRCIGIGLVLVGPPDRRRRAGVAYGARLVHGPQGKWMLETAEQAVDLDAWPIAGRQDRNVTHAAAADASLPGDWDPRAGIELFDRHASTFPSLTGVALNRSSRRLGSLHGGAQWGVGTIPTPPATRSAFRPRYTRTEGGSSQP